MEEFITYLFIVALFGGIIYAMVQFIYVRHGKSYSAEIDDYLARHQLSFKERRQPERLDWEKGPFQRPPAVRISLGTVKVLGVSMPMHDEKFLILDTNEDETIWLRIETMFLAKPSLTFKKQEKPKTLRTFEEIGDQATTACPACNFTLIASDVTCPDCGIQLK